MKYTISHYEELMYLYEVEAENEKEAYDKFKNGTDILELEGGEPELIDEHDVVEIKREDNNIVHMANLLKETIEVLRGNGKTLEDVRFVSSDFGATDIGTFINAADKEYDDDFGAQEVLSSLQVVGDDWWLERHEYDGSEWWEFKALPKQPDTVWENVRLFYSELGDDEWL